MSAEKFLEIEQIDIKLGKKIYSFIKRKFPKRVKILLLSLTGSRAFGWANENYDYDIHGLFYAKNYWGYCHSGEMGWDINLYEFSKFFNYLIWGYQSFEGFMNLSNPFYLDKDFDFKGFLKLCTPEQVKAIEGDIERQIREFETTGNPRAGLHAYRILMVPIFYLRTGKFQLNVFKINKRYKFKQLEKLKRSYIKREGEFNFKEVMRDLKKLKREYESLLKVKKKKLDKEKAKKWYEKIISRLEK